MAFGRVCPILLVEDDPDDTSFVRRALAASKIANQLVVCTTAQEAREYLLSSGNEPPGLAIVDIYLPNGESGLDFLRWRSSNEELREWVDAAA